MTASVSEPPSSSSSAPWALHLPPELRGLFLTWRRRPGLFVRQVMRATPQPWQDEALQLVATEDRVAVRSGHGVGKSAWLSWLTYWFLLTRFPARVPSTAPTAHQLEDVLWGEHAKWKRQMEPAVAELFELTGSKLALKFAPQESYAIARTARKEQPEAFQGFHSDNLLFLGDEASGIDDAIFEVGEGAMSTAGAKTVLTGNPTRRTGYFASCFLDPNVISSWARRKVSCADAPGTVKPAYAVDMAKRYGADSNVYRVRVLGEFPEADEDSVVPLHLIEAAIDRTVEPLTQFRPVWGLDVARFGGDRCALAKRRGNQLLEPVTWWSGQDTMATAGRVLAEYEALADEEEHKRLDPAYVSLLPAEILVDVIGIGAGVLDRLRELGLPARGVNVGETPAEDQRFMRLRDELWWRAREWFEARDCLLPRGDDQLTAELSLPRYKMTSSGKIQVESKDELKKRLLNAQSPDLADAFCLTFAGGVKRVEQHARTRYAAHRRKRPPTSPWAA